MVWTDRLNLRVESKRLRLTPMAVNVPDRDGRLLAQAEPEDT